MVRLRSFQQLYNLIFSFMKKELEGKFQLLTEQIVLTTKERKQVYKATEYGYGEILDASQLCDLDCLDNYQAHSEWRGGTLLVQESGCEGDTLIQRDRVVKPYPALH